MWWIIGLAIAGIFGIAQAILDSLRREVAVERKQWEDSYARVEREIQQQQRLIEQKLNTSIELLQYKEVATLHTASIKVADTTYVLLQGCRKTLDAMGMAIVNTAKQRKILEQRKRTVFFKGDLEKQIVSLHKLRDEILVPDKNKVKAQRNRLSQKVTRLNIQTAELRELKKKLDPGKTSRLEKWVTGTVKWYNQQKGYGFITVKSGQPDIYVNRKQLRGTTYLSDGDRVRFVIRTGNKPWAANVSKL